VLIAGCNVFASSGPRADQIIAAADNQAQTPRQTRKFLFDIVEMEPNVASVVAAYQSPAFNKTFGLGHGGVIPKPDDRDSMGLPSAARPDSRWQTDWSLPWLSRFAPISTRTP